VTFFEHQHQARRRTWLLVVYFALAVALIIAAVNAVVYFVVTMTEAPPPTLDDWLLRPWWLWISLGTAGVILVGTLQTSLRLRGGGRAVAEMTGARRVNPSTQDPDEQRLINVVEEMSIASGTPAPVVYVLDDEPGLNAFVAGLRPTEAVLVVTRGALQTWDRDELQGVVGHEYSHIFNGDMRLNVRLMGILAGILLIGQIGRALMRSSGRSRGKGSGQVVIIGLALFAIGSIGILFGSLIKAAISRQREFLADASAVQFTRNPDGIAGALWKIYQHAAGSKLSNAHSDDLSHFCIGDPIRKGFNSILATHPPLEDRIRKIDPGFIARARAGQVRKRPEPAVAPAAAIPAGASGFAGAAVAASPAQIAEKVGEVSAAHLAHAQQVHAALDPELLDTLRRPEGARDLLYAMLLGAMQATRRAAGKALIVKHHGEAAADRSVALVDPVAKAGANARLNLINLAMPALKQFDQSSRTELLIAADDLVRLDARYSIFEFALMTILRDRLAEDSERHGRPRYFKYAEVLPEIRLLLSVLARVGAKAEDDVARTYRHVMAPFSRESREPTEAAACSLAALTAALAKLNHLAPLLKKSLVEACADCVSHDNKVLPAEAELLQAVALELDCPMPPLVAAA
jgi:Zn-dependent protease with chaperone function